MINNHLAFYFIRCVSRDLPKPFHFDILLNISLDLGRILESLLKKNLIHFIDSNKYYWSLQHIIYVKMLKKTNKLWASQDLYWNLIQSETGIETVNVVTIILIYPWMGITNSIMTIILKIFFKYNIVIHYKNIKGLQ